MKRIILILLLAILLLIVSPLGFASKVGNLTGVNKPNALSVDGDRVYITEGTSVHIYSLDPLKHLVTFGSPGEGPGEFKEMPYVNLVPGALFINNTGKIMYFSRDGVFLKETRLPFHYFYFNYPLLPVKENIACFQLHFDRETKKIAFEGKVYGPDYQLLRSFAEVDSPFLPPPPPPGVKPAKKVDVQVIEDCLEFTAAHEKIFLADSRKGFFISVFDHKGDLLYEKNNKYKKIKVPDDYKENFMKELRKSDRWEQLNTVYNYVFKDHYPPFFSIKVRDERIYALTYDQEEGKREVVVMDLSGKVIGRSFAFPLDPARRELSGFPLYSTTYDISWGNIYYMVENEETESWELYVSKI